MRKPSLIVYDLVGALFVCAAAGLGAWIILAHLPATSERLTAARGQLAEATGTLAKAEMTLRREQAERDLLATDIAQRGALPESTPVEADLRELTRIARDHRVEFVQVTPLAGEKYPGLIELRYAVEARSEYIALLEFLNAFEESQLWADITALEIGKPARDAAQDSERQTSSLVVSLFASREAEGAAVLKQP